MIAMLAGTAAERLDDTVVLDVHGVGYGLLMTNEDQGRATIGQPLKVYVHEHIREQSHDLFGFLQRETMQLFEQLLSVNGVGPKMALAVLSVGNAGEVRAAIAGGDVKFIMQAAGVGKRVAERIVVDLKDKVGLTGVDLASTGMLQGTVHQPRDDAAEALVALGYTASDAAQALQTIDPSLPLEERVRLALKAPR